MTILEHHHDDWPATETTRPPRLHGQSRFVALTRRNMRALEGPPATLFISSWPPSRHSRACMCIWVQGLRRREGGGTDLTPYRTPSGSYAGRSALGMGRLALFLDESWGWVNLPPQVGVGGIGCGCSRSHHAQVPGPWGKRSKTGASNRWDSLRSYGQSGLVLGHDNVGSTKSWGPGLYTCT